MCSLKVFQDPRQRGVLNSSGGGFPMSPKGSCEGKYWVLSYVEHCYSQPSSLSFGNSGFVTTIILIVNIQNR